METPLFERASGMPAKSRRPVRETSTSHAIRDVSGVQRVETGSFYFKGKMGCVLLAQVVAVTLRPTSLSRGPSGVCHLESLVPQEGEASSNELLE